MAEYKSPSAAHTTGSLPFAQTKLLLGGSGGDGGGFGGLGGSGGGLGDGDGKGGGDGGEGGGDGGGGAGGHPMLLYRLAASNAERTVLVDTPKLLKEP